MKKRFIIIFITVLSAMISIATFNPLLGPLARSLGLTEIESGSLVTVTGICWIIGSGLPILFGRACLLWNCFRDVGHWHRIYTAWLHDRRFACRKREGTSCCGFFCGCGAGGRFFCRPNCGNHTRFAADEPSLYVCMVLIGLFVPLVATKRRRGHASGVQPFQ